MVKVVRWQCESQLNTMKGIRGSNIYLQEKLLTCGNLFDIFQWCALLDYQFLINLSYTILMILAFREAYDFINR